MAEAMVVAVGAGAGAAGRCKTVSCGSCGWVNFVGCLSCGTGRLGQSSTVGCLSCGAGANYTARWGCLTVHLR